MARAAPAGHVAMGGCMSAQWIASAWTRHSETTVLADDAESITGKRVVAECEREDEARMVAAAPELLDALREAQIALGLMLSYHGQGSSDYADVDQVRADDAMNIVDAAIAKAVQS